MSVIIDRRLNPKNKSTVNRKRLIDRYKSQLKKAVSNAISGRSITDVNSGEKVTIPAKDLSEPTFRHGQGGHREVVHSGNKDFLPGDKIKRPQSGDGQGGSNASQDGEGTDDFGFEISREEFLELFFEDLELPHLVKRQIASIDNFKWVRAGFTSDGIPANINILRSLRGALGRRLAVGGKIKAQLKQLESELEELEQHPPVDPDQLQYLQNKIAKVHRRYAAIPFIDTFDLKYNNRIKQAFPTTQAVMFCLMDVSGSMDEAKKDVAKRFFILLYLFLTRNYDKIAVVFIRHHTSAKEVDEQEFFYSRETGGTVVSSALELMYKIMMERYPASDWNLYAAQASDGDNWNNDSPRCRDILMDKIMPHMQYFAYVEIMPRHHQSLWEAYEAVKENCPGFAMQNIEDVTDIYPVFRELFKRQIA